LVLFLFEAPIIFDAEGKRIGNAARPPPVKLSVLVLVHVMRVLQG